MIQTFEAPRLTGRRATTYGYDCNDNGAGTRGTFVTASGIDASASNFTCAVPMRGTPNFNPSDPLELGDILLLERDGRTILVVATDVGGMPHEGTTVDLFKGVTTDRIGGDEGRNLTVMRIGHVPREHMREAIRLIGQINRGEDPEEAVRRLRAIYDKEAKNFELASYVANPANRSTLLAQAPEQGPTTSGTGGHRTRTHESTDEPRVQTASYTPDEPPDATALLNRLARGGTVGGNAGLAVSAAYAAEMRAKGFQVADASQGNKTPGPFDPGASGSSPVLSA